MQPAERDLGGAGEVEVVGRELVDVRLGRGEPAGADQRLLADEHRRQHGEEALRGEALEREPVERKREQGGVADPVAEPRAGDLRGPLHLEPADLGVLERLRELRDLTDAADLLGVLLAQALGHRRMRRVRNPQRQVVAGGLGGGELLLRSLQLLLDALELLELLRRRLALQLRRAAQLVHARDERAPALVGLEQRVERLGRSLAGERRAEAVGVGAGCLEVDHAAGV